MRGQQQEREKRAALHNAVCARAAAEKEVEKKEERGGPNQEGCRMTA